MAEIYSDYQEIYKMLGEIQPKIDELFHQAVESSEFQSATILVRLNVGAEGKVDNAEVLSEEYKKSKFGKTICELAAKSLVPGEKFKNGALRMRFIWSDAYNLVGESVMAPLNAEHVAKIYTGGVILKKYAGSIQEMFRKLDTLIGGPAYGDTVVEVNIVKGGKVESSNLVNQALRGTLLDQHAAELVKSWQFPGIKDGLKVKVALRRGVSQTQVNAAAAGKTLGGGVATEVAAYPTRQGVQYGYRYFPVGPAHEPIAYPTRPGLQYGYPYLQYGHPPFHGGPATEVIAYPTRPGLQYGYPSFHGGPATELIAYPSRQALDAAYAQQQYAKRLGGGVATEVPAYPARQAAYPYAYQQYRQPVYGGVATELVAYPTRQGWQYGYLPFHGGPATEVIAYPTRPGLQYGYPPFHGGPATELVAYPTRQALDAAYVQQQYARQQYAKRLGGGVATEVPAYPVRQAAYPYAYQQYRQPIYGGVATELVAYPTRQGWQYGYLPFHGGPATEVAAYPTRPGLQYGYPYLQYGYPPFHGGPATELIAYPTRQGLG